MKSFLVRVTAPPGQEHVSPDEQFRHMHVDPAWKMEVVSEEALDYYPDPSVEMHLENIELKRCLVAALELCKTLAGINTGGRLR